MMRQWQWCQAVPLAILGVSAACMPAGAATETSKVMGSVEVGAGERTGDVSTVNGSIRIGENAVVGSAHTVNGSISLEANASAAELDTVNGSIHLAERAKVSGKATTVNGKLSLADGVDVGGTLSNVNGAVRVGAAHVGGGIDVVNGGMELGPNARIEGGIHMHKQNGGWLNWGSDSPPRVIIGPGSEVRGTLNFERPVKLYVSDKATIGPVQGATVEKYSGERPPD